LRRAFWTRAMRKTIPIEYWLLIEPETRPCSTRVPKVHHRMKAGVQTLAETLIYMWFSSSFGSVHRRFEGS
jgi:hypothetical protein